MTNPLEIPRPNRNGCSVCSSRTKGLCAPWSTDEMGIFASIKGHRRVAQARTDLYRQGEPYPDYLVLLDGWVGLRVMLEDGSWHMPDFALPGALLGMQPGSGAMTHSAACLTTVTVCPLPRTRLDALTAANPRLGLRLVHLAACREARLQDHFTNVTGRAARERVAHLLMELFYRVRRRLPVTGNTVQLPITLAHMGEALNLTEVHVSRMLAVLRVQDVAHFFRYKLTILDADAFMRAAGFDGDIAVFEDEATTVPERDRAARPLAPA